MNKSVVNVLIIVAAAVVLFIVLKYLNSQNVGWVPDVPLNKNKELYTNIGEEIEDIASDVVSGASNVAQDVVSGASNLAQDVISGASSVTQDVVQGAARAIGGVGDALEGAVEDVGGSIEGSLSGRGSSLRAQDLLPTQSQDVTDFTKTNPSGSGSLSGVALLNAGNHLGINTVGQSLRNANLQLRSDPPNPKTKVSPWLNSTIDADNNRKTFEIGCAC